MIPLFDFVSSLPYPILMQIKIFTKRHGEEPPVQGATILQETISQLRGPELVPKGVYRFSCFEEADEWMNQKIVSTRVLLKSKTFSKSAGH